MKNNSKDLKAISEVVLDKLCSYLAKSQAGNEKILIQRPAKQIAQQLQLEKWVKEGGFDPASVSKFMDDYLSNTQHIHHPHYIYLQRL